MLGCLGAIENAHQVDDYMQEEAEGEQQQDVDVAVDPGSDDEGGLWPSEWLPTVFEDQCICVIEP